LGSSRPAPDSVDHAFRISRHQFAWIRVISVAAFPSPDRDLSELR
jgi:hypothetical protein